MLELFGWMHGRMGGWGGSCRWIVRKKKDGLHKRAESERGFVRSLLYAPSLPSHPPCHSQLEQLQEGAVYLVTNLKPSVSSRQQQALGDIWPKREPTGVSPAIGDFPKETQQRQLLLRPSPSPIHLSCTRFTSWMRLTKPGKVHLR